MPRRADGVAHVVQAVEVRDEVVVVAREVLRLRDLEGDAVGDAGSLRALAGELDGAAW